MESKFNIGDEVVIFSKSGITCIMKFGRINKINKVDRWGRTYYQCNVVSISYRDAMGEENPTFTTMNIPVQEDDMSKIPHGVFQHLGLK